MISKSLVVQIERHSNRLTQEVMAAIRNDSRVSAYHGVPATALRELTDRLFKNLGHWLTSRTDFAVEMYYQKLGRERFLQGVPMSQLVFALGIVRATLLSFLRGSVMGDEDELPLAHETTLAICDFFEKAVYYAARGYEDAQAAGLSAEGGNAQEAADIARSLPRRAELAWDPATEWDPNISRGGDVGEVSG